MSKEYSHEYPDDFSDDFDVIIDKDRERAEAGEDVEKALANEEDIVGTEGAAWKEALTFDEHGVPKRTIANLTLILMFDSELAGRIWYNEFRQRLVVRKDLLEDFQCADSVNGSAWTDATDSLVLAYLERKYRMTSTGAALLNHGLNMLKLRRRFHPVRDYLHSVEWDRKHRIDRLFVDYLGAEDNRYTRLSARKWMIAAASRILYPGIKYDDVPIIEGPQGLRKSTFVETLAVHPEWFTDTVGDIRNEQKVVQNILGKWIIELPELMAFAKIDIEIQKAFLSRRVDNVRLPYGHHNEDFPRQCVFLGTTNENEDYFTDRTGNRRKHPIRASLVEIDIDRLVKVRDQLWAEALHYAKSREALYLDDTEAQTIAKEEQALRVPKSELTGMIEMFLDKPVSPSWWTYNGAAEDFDDLQSIDEPKPRDFTCLLELWVDMLGLDPSELTALKRRELLLALKAVDGWESSTDKTTVRYARFGVQKVYRRKNRANDEI